MVLFVLYFPVFLVCLGIQIFLSLCSQVFCHTAVIFGVCSLVFGDVLLFLVALCALFQVVFVLVFCFDVLFAVFLFFLMCCRGVSSSSLVSSSVSVCISRFGMSSIVVCLSD